MVEIMDVDVCGRLTLSFGAVFALTLEGLRQ